MISGEFGEKLWWRTTTTELDRRGLEKGEGGLPSLEEFLKSLPGHSLAVGGTNVGSSERLRVGVGGEGGGEGGGGTEFDETGGKFVAPALEAEVRAWTEGGGGCSVMNPEEEFDGGCGDICGCSAECGCRVAVST